MEHQLPVAVVCRVLGAPRSSIYARRAQVDARDRPGPATSISDPDLLRLIRQVLVASPFAGEGYRKVRARLRREHGVRVSGKRVLRLLRREGLLAPQRVRGRRKPRPHDGTIIPEAPTSAGALMPPWPGPELMGGCGCLPASTTTPPRPGRRWPRSATASPPSSRSPTPSSTAGRLEADVARGLALRHDWGPQYRSAHFTGSLAWLGISDDPAFLGEPETNGCAEPWIRTLTEQCLWVQLHDTVEELGQAVAGFVERYNSSWLIQRHSHQTPKEAYQPAQAAAAA
jgi:transposase InsO family protein